MAADLVVLLCLAAAAAAVEGEAGAGRGREGGMLSRLSLRPPRHAWAGSAARGVCSRGPAGEPAPPPRSLCRALRTGAGPAPGAEPPSAPTACASRPPAARRTRPAGGAGGPVLARGPWVALGRGGGCLGDGFGKRVWICMGRAAPLGPLPGGVAVRDAAGAAALPPAILLLPCPPAPRGSPGRFAEKGGWTRQEVWAGGPSLGLDGAR